MLKKYLEIFKNHNYIFNLGHGMIPETNPDSVKILVDFVKEFQMNKDHQINYGKTGVILINLTSDSTSWWDIRKYLKEFLSDRRVIEVNPLIWQIILNLFILTLQTI